MTHPMQAAAKAVAAENNIDPDAQSWIPKGNEDRPGQAWEMFVPQARAAITAFLDAADADMHHTGRVSDGSAGARIGMKIIAALKRIAEETT